MNLANRLAAGVGWLMIGLIAVEASQIAWAAASNRLQSREPK